MRLVPYSDITASTPAPQALMAALKQGFIDFSLGFYDIAPVGYLKLPAGELHLKFGRAELGEWVVIKLASGCYDNHLRGLPSSYGCIMLMDAATGQMVALLEDRGLLTELRTAAAAAMVAKEVAPDAKVLGVIGAGTQGYYQALYHCRALGLKQVQIYSRSPDRAETLASKLAAEGIQVVRHCSAEALCRQSDLIVTATPSEEPIVALDWLKPNVHINAVGADSPGKRELSETVIQSAKLLLADSMTQSLEHGEFQYLAKTQAQEVREFGEFLASGECVGDGISIADFTGVAVQDIIIASLVYREYLKRQDGSWKGSL